MEGLYSAVEKLLQDILKENTDITGLNSKLENLELNRTKIDKSKPIDFKLIERRERESKEINATNDVISAKLLSVEKAKKNLYHLLQDYEDCEINIAIFNDIKQIVVSKNNDLYKEKMIYSVSMNGGDL